MLFNLIASMSFSQIDLENGLVAYYPFNGNSEDESENNHHGQVFGASLVEDCEQNANSAYYFDGVDDYIQVAYHPDLDFELDQNFAISLLFRAENLNPNQSSSDLISKWNSTHKDTAFSYAIRMRSQDHDESGLVSLSRFDSDDPGCTFTTTVLKSQQSYLDYEWHHVVAQINNNYIMELYLDGKLVNATEDQSLCSVLSDSDIFFGNRSVSNPYRPFKGTMDEIRFYDRALTLDEIEFLSGNKIVSTDDLYENQIQIVPNPVSDKLEIVNTADRNIIGFEVFDNTGKHIANYQSNQIQFSGQTGLYLLRIKFEDGSSQVLKFIKE